MRKILRIVVMATLVVVVGSAAACQTVTECGTVVTQDATLTQDITGCVGDALLIGADDITLDLNGHTVSSVDGVGIRLAGRDAVTIEDGRAEGATAGLALSDASDLRVRRVTARSSGRRMAGMLLERVTASRISQSTGDGDDGFRLIESHGNSIRRSLGTDSDGESVQDLRLEGSHRNRITESTFDGGGQFTRGDSVNLVDSDDNVLADNRAAGGDGIGIGLNRADHTVLRRNVVSSDGAPVFISISVINSPDSLLADNREVAGAGIYVLASDRTTVRANQVAGIGVADSDDMVVDLNVVTSIVGRLFDGIVVSESSSGARVSDNRATGFEDDGIQIDAPGAVVTRNVATDNGDLGIEAVPGVVDGGGNQASGNGNPAQCTGVSCTAPPA